ncbi:MAG: TRAP transporter substrate-binding protein [Rhodobacteraceae bacterium]|nr:TRAP transporter substrate-binding protein [Paracoccaceae bacterium]
MDHRLTSNRAMPNRLRRVLLGATLAAAAQLALPASMAEAQDWPRLTFRVTMTVSPSEPLGQGVQHFIDRLAAETGGRVTAEFFPSGQLGQDLEVFEQLSDGTVHMHASGFGINANYNSFYAPWLFTSFAHVQRVLDSEMAQGWNAALTAERGVSVLMAYPRAPRHITSNGRPVRTPADLAGLRIRVPQIPILFNTFAELGADAVAMGFGEVYSSLQAGLIQAQENPLPTIAGFSIQEVQEYISLTGHVLAPEYIYVNTDWWDGLPDGLRVLMTDLLKEGQGVAAEATARVEAEVIASITAAGGTEIVESDVAAFRAAARPILDRIGPEQLGAETYRVIVDLAD